MLSSSRFRIPFFLRSTTVSLCLASSLFFIAFVVFLRPTDGLSLLPNRLPLQAGAFHPPMKKRGDPKPKISRQSPPTTRIDDHEGANSFSSFSSFSSSRRRSIFARSSQGVAAATVAAAALTAPLLRPADAAPVPPSPVTTTTSAASLFDHSYSDPLHPLCERRIRVGPDGRSFHYDGTGVKSPPGELRGCTPEEIREYGGRTSAFDGDILPGNVVTAGDGIHEGVWEPAGSGMGKKGLEYGDVDGIRWNDGNKWIVIDEGGGSGSGIKKGVGAVVAYVWLGLSAFAGVKGVSDRMNTN